jgi:hypothetical protein
MAWLINQAFAQIFVVAASTPTAVIAPHCLREPCRRSQVYGLLLAPAVVIAMITGARPRCARLRPNHLRPGDLVYYPRHPFVALERSGRARNCRGVSVSKPLSLLLRRICGVPDNSPFR